MLGKNGMHVDGESVGAGSITPLRSQVSAVEPAPSIRLGRVRCSLHRTGSRLCSRGSRGAMTASACMFHRMGDGPGAWAWRQAACHAPVQPPGELSKTRSAHAALQPSLVLPAGQAGRGQQGLPLPCCQQALARRRLIYALHASEQAKLRAADLNFHFLLPKDLNKKVLRRKRK